MKKERKRVLFIYNPVSGRGRSQLSIADLSKAFPSDSYKLDVHLTQKQGDATALVQEYGHRSELVVCVGGDGTLNETVSGLIQAGLKTPIGYIPAGTTNDIARTLEIPVDFDEAAAIIRDGEPFYQDVGVFNQESYFTYIASFGSFTEASYLTPQWAKNFIGYPAYLMGGIKNLNSLHPYKLRVVADGIDETDNFIFGSVMNSTSVGGVISFKKSQVDLNDGLFETFLIRYPKNPLEFTYVLDCLRRQKLDEDWFIFIPSESVKFEFENEVAWTVDGEFAGQFRQLEIEVIKSAFQIILKP